PLRLRPRRGDLDPHALDRRAPQRRVRPQDGAHGGDDVSSATVERRMHARRRRRRLLKRGAWDLLGIALFVVLVFPVYWMVSTAFKPDEDIDGAEPTWFSLSPTLKHFRDAMARPYFWDIVQNSLIVVLVAVGASIVLAFLAAVAL